jgi:hypothetical protein
VGAYSFDGSAGFSAISSKLCPFTSFAARRASAGVSEKMSRNIAGSGSGPASLSIITTATDGCATPSGSTPESGTGTISSLYGLLCDGRRISSRRRSPLRVRASSATSRCKEQSCFEELSEKRPASVAVPSCTAPISRASCFSGRLFCIDVEIWERTCRDTVYSELRRLARGGTYSGVRSAVTSCARAAGHSFKGPDDVPDPP